jgi:histidyl-tRNA synthetase
LFINFGEKESLFAQKIARQLRESGLKTEVYPENAKLKKQTNYANDKQIKFVILAGEEVINQNKVTLKNMQSGEQSMLSVEEIARHIS